MEVFAKSLEKLIREFTKMPSVGPKSAQRLAFHFVRQSREEAENLCRALMEMKDKIKECSRCHNLAEEELCLICASPSRKPETLCVVSDFRDLAAIERTGRYRGVYHVLGGLISPMDGIGPEDLHIASIAGRIEKEGIEEVIFATSPTINGETTALYIMRLIQGLDVRMTRIAYGIPVGGNLEYADDMTLSRAIEGRQQLGPVKD